MTYAISVEESLSLVLPRFYHSDFEVDSSGLSPQTRLDGKASGYGPEGWGFESLSARHLTNDLRPPSGWLSFCCHSTVAAKVTFCASVSWTLP
jgi:hypothetical protein